MTFLLDTHAFLWFVNNHRSLSTEARNTIEDRQSLIFLSIASVWEMAIKSSLGKLAVPMPHQSFVEREMSINEIAIFPASIEHAEIVANLPFPSSGHRDPFDRLLIAQALAENIPVISGDAAFDQYPVERIW